MLLINFLFSIIRIIYNQSRITLCLLIIITLCIFEVSLYPSEAALSNIHAGTRPSTQKGIGKTHSDIPKSIRNYR
jgi:hypothetical protein